MCQRLGAIQKPTESNQLSTREDDATLAASGVSRAADGYWRGRRVLVAGAAGFIGSQIAELLVEWGANVTAAVSLSQAQADTPNLERVREQILVCAVDLTRFEDCCRVSQEQDVVINAAHAAGNLAFRRKRPALVFRTNTLITLNMLEAACECGVDRFLVMSSAELYAFQDMIPYPDRDGAAGGEAQVIDGYVWSKRASEFAAVAYAHERGLKVAIARPSNAYGPRDRFDPASSRVIPTFIRKVFQGERIVIWGTGEQVRAFVYVEDLARGLLTLVERYPVCDPVSFRGSQEIAIRDLAALIVQLCGRDAEIICDPDKPSGPLRRVADGSTAERVLGFSELVPLEVGLKRTIEGYWLRWLGQRRELASLPQDRRWNLP